MHSNLIFDCIVADSIDIISGEPMKESYVLFKDHESGELEDDVRSVSEDPLLRWLFNPRNGKALILDKLGISADSSLSFSVREPVTDKHNEIDIDLILCERDNPALAIGIQAKRVKVLAENEKKDRVNKLGDISHLVKQANYQRKHFGFHRNYLVVIIQTLGKNRTQENFAFRGATPERFREIWQFPHREKVHPDVGIIFIQIVQPSSRSFQKTRKICICIDKEANRLDQTATLTNKINELISNK